MSAPVAAPTTPTAPAQPATPAPEDRSNWVPPYRIREISTRHEQALATERARFEAERVALQRQLQALTGVLPPQNPEIDQVKNQFKQVFPELSEIGSKAEAINELIAIKDQLLAAMNYQWETHNRGAMDRLYKAAEVTYGTNLNEEARHQLGASFIGYLQANPDAADRYQRDPGVVDEFWKAFTDRFISPIQRSQTVNTLNRLPGNIPQDSPSGSVPVSSPVKPANQDERLQAALDLYKAKSTTGF